ncbi:6-carboxytetrahydropterin synthase QueD [Seleniivibrio woodruffii]|uniref:6-carboxy-5,6,7,8-tetrahydropterin synthase n=1 Tax=Seleniivibrio woodruffii TaxID=1078050 RepID=A0A4R1K9T1_9BACT|nr:6-carboxytetrahydropterin synthase QueD [Seleniivibrio woodruffii]TCK60790.1 preQ(0) biosynthesis protein QueD [Seleniivibrio woodruffii]TVZ36420.1 preQ(0) biosynthesis protein QueD [Seleniivibrio woodruffii]
MFRVRVIQQFNGAHNLRNYNGKCENLHGHNWRVEAYLQGDKLNGTEMLVDFTVLKKRLKDILEELDHKYLNEQVEFFVTHNPTSENIARFIYGRLKETFGTLTERVVVWETDVQAAEYFE